MGVKGKIVALIVAIATMLLPFSQMACTRGTCRLHDSSSMPCHAMHAHQSTDGLEAASDHSCCRLLPLVPTPPRDRMIVKTIQQAAPVFLWNYGGVQAMPEIRDEGPLGDGPPEIERQSLLCVLQI
jgi:hypothetical protein